MARTNNDIWDLASSVGATPFVDEVLRTEHYRRYLSIAEPLYAAPREVRFPTPID